MSRIPSDLTVTDIFCGAGGNTIGAKQAGMRVRVGLNHWDRAIETYGRNNGDVDVIERVDVSLCDPRRYPSTDIAIMSPECTTHSPAGGNKHRRVPDLFDQRPIDAATVRSRVTMFDVVRFTEFHRYRIVIVENVVEATGWALFPDWLQMMDHLGYRHQLLSLNSMFFHPTPQSRDRIYVVFWRKGNTAPALDFRPIAPCRTCGDVRAVQAWKLDRTIGKHKRQYVYLCPGCARELTPYYYAALNALDFSLAAERIGDRTRPLRPRTMERIRFGLEKYGRRTLVVNVKQGARDSSRAWPADTRELGSVPTWDNYFGVAQPSAFLVETTQVHDARRRPRSLTEPMPAMGTQLTSALVSPFFVSAGSRESIGAGTDAMPTQTASERLGIVSPYLVACANAGSDERRILGTDEPLRTVHAGGGNHAVIQGAAQISMRDANAMRVAGLDAELMTQGCGPQQAIMSPAPFLVSQYGTNNASPLDAAVPSVTTIDRHELVQPVEQLCAEDCYFRMLQPHEIGAAMAFPSSYEVTGNKRDRVKQYGNAVTPPVMDWIVRQCAATLAPELSEEDAA